MIEVYTVPISKAQFRKLPPKERAMVFVCCHILNQISVFVKLVWRLSDALARSLH
jgi:hypothetical protein